MLDACISGGCVPVGVRWLCLVGTGITMLSPQLSSMLWFGVYFLGCCSGTDMLVVLLFLIMDGVAGAVSSGIGMDMVAWLACWLFGMETLACPGYGVGCLVDGYVGVSEVAD